MPDMEHVRGLHDRSIGKACSQDVFLYHVNPSKGCALGPAHFKENGCTAQLPTPVAQDHKLSRDSSFKGIFLGAQPGKCPSAGTNPAPAIAETSIKH